MVGKLHTVGIAAKPENPQAAPIIAELAGWLVQRGLQYQLDTIAAEYLAQSGITGRTGIAREELAGSCSPVIVLGGDGTFLSVCRHAAPEPPIIIGVNLGTLGFLTEVTTDELFPLLEAVLHATAILERRALLHAQIRTAAGGCEEFDAVNDIVISKETLARIFTTDVYVDQSFAASLRGDGVIVASPTGSTAYSLAAGGSIVHPEVSALLLTPICSHSLTTRPLVLPGTCVIELFPADIFNVGAVFLSVDGQTGRKLQEGESVRIYTSSRSFFLAKSPSRSYYQVLGAKLKWAAS